MDLSRRFPLRLFQGSVLPLNRVSKVVRSRGVGWEDDQNEDDIAWR
jgi:hypothetical protein